MATTPFGFRNTRPSTTAKYLEPTNLCVYFPRLAPAGFARGSGIFHGNYTDVFARAMHYWENFIKNHIGLIHIAFGTPTSSSSAISAASPGTARINLVMSVGTPLSMAVNTGPIPQDRFLSRPNSKVPINRPDSQELRFHGGMLFHIASMRGSQRGQLLEHLTLDRDEWLLEKLLATDSDPPPIARFRGNVRAGPRQGKLLSFYVRAGWYIAGTQTWRDNILTEGSESSVLAAERRGDDMEQESLVVEKVFTVAQLEWQIRKNKRALAELGARL